jgi:hypothetical protein
MALDMLMFWLFFLRVGLLFYRVMVIHILAFSGHKCLVKRKHSAGMEVLAGAWGEEVSKPPSIEELKVTELCICKCQCVCVCMCE